MTPGSAPTLITGASGCIGAWAVRHLIHDGTPVIAFDLHENTDRLRLLLSETELSAIRWAPGDITQIAAVEHALDDHGVQAVIHLAGLQAPLCRADPPLGALVNVVGTVNLLEAIARRSDYSYAPFVYASSVAAAPVADERFPTTSYGVYKLACEGVADVYLRERGISSIGLRAHTVYGPGRDQGLTSAPTLAMVAAAAGRSYDIPFTGRLTMQYAPDVAGAFIAASRCGTYRGAEVFDLPGHSADVLTVIDAIEAATAEAAITCSGLPLPFAADVAPRADAPFAAALTRTPLEEGIADAVTRFRDLLDRGLVSAPEA